MNRREFLAALAATYGTGACAWAAPRSWFIEYAGTEDSPPRERFVNTLCSMCAGGCGLTVRVVHGCAVGVRGNLSHPINRGGLCSRGSAVLQDVYNPDRIRTPLKRVGARGSGKWEPVDWTTAIGMVAERLRSIRDDTGPHGLCVVLGVGRGVTRTAWERFTQAYGSPNLIDTCAAENLGPLSAVLATHGVRQRVGYDLANAGYILSFSSGWLDTHWSTEQAARAFADFRRGRPGYRPRCVHVGPRYSLTAAKADKWIPTRPGTEGTVALGIAHVIIREGLYDREFVRRYGHGFESTTDRDGREHPGFREMVLRDFTPARVQTLTGVPEGTIFHLGREFGTGRPAVALGYDGGGCETPATYDRMAIHCLNALVGSIDVPGGVTLFRELSLLAGDVPLDDTAENGLAHPRLDGPVTRRRLADHGADLLANAITSGRPYRTEALILADADPAFALAEGESFAAALSAIPFVAAFGAYHNDSNRHADVILPTPHGFHRWDFDVAHTLKGHPVVTVSHPVLPGPPDGRAPYGVLRAIATRIGGTVASALPWRTDEEMVEAVCRKLFDAGRGAPFGSANEESWAQLLESRGWRAPFSGDFEAFRGQVTEGGGWTDPIYFHREWDRVFRNPSRRFAFSSAYLARSFEGLPEPDGVSDPDRRCLPDCRCEERRHDAAYPLELYVYALPNLSGVSSPNLPWLNDIAGAYMFQKWRTWVEVHPETAEHYGISDGEHVVVRTPRGRQTLPVKVYAGLLPEVIAIPYGLGHKSGGRWCRNVGVNPATLVDARPDPLTGTALWTSTRASIHKV